MMDKASPATQALQDGKQHLALGRRLRALRQAREMTLAELAERSSLAISTLSRAERGLLALTYDKLMKVAEGLGVDLGALFQTSGAVLSPSSLNVARIGDVRIQETETYRYEILFADVLGKGMTTMTGTVKARSPTDFAGMIRHPGEEFVFVLSGVLTVYSDGNPPVTLKPGESLYFDSRMGHIYTAATDEDCRILVVCLPRNEPDDR